MKPDELVTLHFDPAAVLPYGDINSFGKFGPNMDALKRIVPAQPDPHDAWDQFGKFGPQVSKTVQHLTPPAAVPDAAPAIPPVDATPAAVPAVGNPMIQRAGVGGAALGGLAGGYAGGEIGDSLAKGLGAGKGGQLVGRRAGNVLGGVGGIVGGKMLGEKLGGMIQNANMPTNEPPAGYDQWTKHFESALAKHKS